MSISDAQYSAWLRDPTAIRCLLFEVGVYSGGSEITRYLSTTGYTTGAADTPASTTYLGIGTGGLTITESVSLTGQASLSIGDIKVANQAGERDSWLADVWTNRPIAAFLGDVRWPRADFRPVFSGVVADIGSEDRGTLNLILSNKLQRLNTAVSDVKLGGIVSYAQSGTTVTVTKARHGRNVGSPVEVHPTSGTAVVGVYTILATPTVDTFTYTAGTSLTTSGLMTLGGVNADNIIPLVFGECHNITPLLVDGRLLEYQCHGGPVQDIFEVRDNGKPVAATVTNATGTFRLLAAPAGAITASVQGDTPAGTDYANTVAQLVQRIVTGFGVTASLFTSGDLDAASLAAFDAAHQQPVGLYLTDRSNVLAACQQLAATLQAQLVMTRAGLLRLVQISFPPAGTPTVIAQSSQIDRTLTIVARSTVAAAVKLNYVKNWTVQPGLQTAIPAEHKEMFASEWWTVTSVNAAVAAAYKLNAEPVPSDTLLLTREDAQAEADRRLVIASQVRTTYRFEGTAAHMELELGQAVTLFSNRFGLAGGALGVVTSLAPDWQNCHVTVEITV
jgi:hypothetical protein